MAPRVIFEQQLELLKEKFVRMGECVQSGYRKLEEALRENDREKLNALLGADRQMLDMQREIENACLGLMTRQQPVARDLRLVSSALKVVTDMERTGDHVSEVAELFLRRSGEKLISGEGCDEMLLSMMKEAFEMFQEAVEAFVEGREEAARGVIARDDVVDDYFNGVKQNMLEAIKNQTCNADEVVDNLMIAKYLEKVGDHAVQIASWAVFMVTGELD